MCKTPWNLRSLTLTALFAALTAAGAFFKFPLGAAAFSLQFFFTAMAGILLGPGWGAASQAVYVALGLAGLPVFVLGGGLGYVFQPSFGFLLGLIPAAWIIGRTAGPAPGAVRTVFACAAGLAVLYAVGVPYLSLILNGYLQKGLSLSEILWTGMAVYLPGDALKIAAAAALAPALTRALAPVRGR